tara:strand:- start:326 stop:1204 length:879 start_codon:yes stop_codon:yes gene_type:complete
MLIIDSHSHFEPRLLNERDIINRMQNHNITKIAFMSKVTEEPLYKKSNLLMNIQKTILTNNNLRFIAKELDKSFHKNQGEWNPWYKKILGNKKNYKILLKPDNKSVFNLVSKHPKKFYGWLFLNPLISNYLDEFNLYKNHINLVGIKVHPFWHRYDLSYLEKIFRLCRTLNMPIMIHLGFQSTASIKKMIIDNKDIRFILCHAGFPYYQELWVLFKNIKNVYFDISSHHVSKKIITSAINTLGYKKFIYGVDDPYGDDDAGIKIQNWIRSMDLNNEEKECIMSKTFLSLINE